MDKLLIGFCGFLVICATVTAATIHVAKFGAPAILTKSTQHMAERSYNQQADQQVDQLRFDEQERHLESNDLRLDKLDLKISKLENDSGTRAESRLSVLEMQIIEVKSRIDELFWLVIGSVSAIGGGVLAGHKRTMKALTDSLQDMKE